ncbi:MAG TPA: autotransporter domain-containing protein [Steroidobacter sp.]|uniref:autotransporter domain-containing protein n=1 Tax=Steroidobacter sp. TaxID=1978227 RepID=UPI002ED85B09
MKVTALLRAGRQLVKWAGGAALLAMAPLALAVPPNISGTLAVPIPDIDEAVVVNLRVLGVLTGSASITVNEATVLLNGQIPSELTIEPYAPVGATGAVCLRVFNGDYTFSTNDTLSVQLSASNLLGETFDTGAPGIPIANVQGPTVDVDDPAQVAACGDPNSPPEVSIVGGDRTVDDSDLAPGESVPFSATVVDPENDIGTYEWYIDNSDSPVSTVANPTLTLPDGTSTISLVVTDGGGLVGSATVLVTVAAAPGLTANAGGDRTVSDTDAEDGAEVTLDGSLSTSTDGAIASYRWSRFLADETEVELGTSNTPTLTVRLPNGENLIRLVVTDGTGRESSDFALITVSEGPAITTLSDIPNLTPNQRRIAQALDRVCGQLRDLSNGEGPALTSDQQDLLARCNGLQTNNTAANQVAALEEMIAEDFAVARTQTLLFANTQYASVMDRLMALRGGAKGLSLAGLNIIVDGKSIPLAQLQNMVKGLLGGGASADEPGLLSDKWGMWARGNYSFGDKDRSDSSPAFDADQWSLVGGLDYRFSDKLVAGLSLAYGQASIDFSPSGEGSLDTDTWALSLYGSAYAARNFYLDGIVNVANASYGAVRNISYVDGTGLVDVDAHGDTDGMTYSAGLSGGYDFLVGGLTLSPNIGLFYIDATIDSFTERGAGGLNLIYDEQSFQSFTGNIGLRATYAWNLSWGVLLPHVRVDYVREFKNDADVFGVRFAADPNANSAPPILVETDNPDESYWRLAAGFSAQFIHGISAYIEYQRLESFEFISFQDVSVGLRMQHSF